MNKTLMVTAVATLFALVSFTNGQIVYQIDDGVSENNLGQGANGDFLWGNYFNEVTDGSTITGLSIAFGDVGVPVGTPFLVAIYDDMDDDGDPTTNLMFLGSTAGTVDSPSPVGMDMFQAVDIPDTAIAGGFFVAALIDGTDNPLPANLDQSTSLGQSWFAEHNAIGGLDISDPFGTGTLSGLIDDFGFPGNFLVRAESNTDDCLLGDVNLDGEVTLLDVTPFIDVLTTGFFQCEADVNLDGVVTLLDVGPFVAILTGG